MSHFTVLCIGNDPEKQLEKYDENIEAPERQEELVSDQDKEEFLAFYQNFDPERKHSKITQVDVDVNKTLTFPQLYAKYGNDWNSNTWKINSDGLWASFTTYNPDSKWDWYTLGGRWTGFFKPKTGDKAVLGRPGVFGNEAKDGWCDQAKKKDIDFEGMRDEAGARAVKRYNEIKTLFGGTIPKLNYKWSEYHLEDGPFAKLSIEEKREHYHAQPAMLEVAKHPEELGWGFDLDEYDCTVEEFEQRARNTAISTYAVVKDGVWYQKGDMGWWGMSTNEKDNWEEEFNKLIDEAKPSTLFSLFDCHI